MTTQLSIKEYVQSDDFKLKVTQALPSGINADRFMRCFFTQIQKTPKLLACDKMSIYTALVKSAEMGLFPNGYEAHLIPYKTTCTLIADYKGIVKLILQSGSVASVYASIVCENDEFVFNSGSIERHVVDFKKPRGQVYAVYAQATLLNGSKVADAMSLEEVEAIRKRSKSSGNGPWQTDWNEMAKKTVTKRLSKFLPLSAEARNAVYSDDDATDFSKIKQAVPNIELPDAEEAEEVEETEINETNNQ
jgi:recombination protein RecT